MKLNRNTGGKKMNSKLDNFMNFVSEVDKRWWVGLILAIAILANLLGLD